MCLANMGPGNWADWAAAVSSLFVGVVAAIIALHQVKRAEDQIERNDRYLLRQCKAVVKGVWSTNIRLAADLEEIEAGRKQLKLGTRGDQLKSALAAVEHYLGRNPPSLYMVGTLLTVAHEAPALIDALAHLSETQTRYSRLVREDGEPNQYEVGAAKRALPKLKAAHNVIDRLVKDFEREPDLGYLPRSPEREER